MSNFLLYQFRFALPIWFVMGCFFWLPDNRLSIRIRGYFISIFLPGKPIGFKIGRDVTLLGINNLNIGRDVYIAKGCWVNALGGVTIHDEVMLAPYVVIASTKHTFKDGSVTKGSSEFKQVIIGNGSWIAAHSTIIAGVTVSNGTLVAANSTVTQQFNADSIISGVPAKIIGKNYE